MVSTELKEIRKYWNQKYPNVFITLYSNEEHTRYFGKMMGSTETVDLSANTIGELINQGEIFLRKLSCGKAI